MLSVVLLIHFIVDLIVVVGYLFHATSQEQEYCCIEYICPLNFFSPYPTKMVTKETKVANFFFKLLKCKQAFVFDYSNGKYPFLVP